MRRFIADCVLLVGTFATMVLSVPAVALGMLTKLVDEWGGPDPEDGR